MKTTTKKSAFGFSAVNAGQRNVAVDPQIIATSTLGAFRLTAPVTKVLGIQPGDYVMFVNNIDKIDAALAAQTEDVVAFAEEHGLALGSPELAIAMHKEFDMWGVAKGIQLYNSKGIPQTVKERLTVKDKEAIVRTNFASLLEAALASDNAELVEALSREGVTMDEQVALLVDTIDGQEVAKYQGSKTANPSGLTGCGVAVNFTDSNVWNQLKADMAEATEQNRIFDIDTTDVLHVAISNGYEEVDVPFLVLGDYTDKAPSRRGAEAVEE